MSVELELATIGQIAEELKKRQDVFVLICCKEPKQRGHDDVMEVGLMSYGHPLVLISLLQQAAYIIDTMPPNGPE